MYRLVILAIFLSGCATQSNKLISPADSDKVNKTLLVSTLGDSLECSFTGLTVFNNTNKTFRLNAEVNEEFSSEITTLLNSKGIEVVPLSRDALSFKNKDKRAQEWANIKFKDPSILDKDIKSLIIFDGNSNYFSTGGYYARNNALQTDATLYVYEMPSGKLLGRSSAQRSDLLKVFSCDQESIPLNSYMLALIRSAGRKLSKELTETLFIIRTDPTKSSKP